MENNNQNLSNIENIYKENFSNITAIFLKKQRLFLNGIYNRYFNDLESGNIVLYFAKNLHRRILSERINDLNYNISFSNFWSNHGKIEKQNLSIISIAKETGLARETVRRKVHKLINENILRKKDSRIFWEPNNYSKITYDKIIEKEVNELCEFIYILSLYSGLEISKSKITDSIKKNFSYFWYHYLDAQLKYFHIWQEEFNDLELLLIYLECNFQANRIYENKKVDYENHFLIKKTYFKGIIPSVSATTINDITNIPRASCIRKLDKLVKIRILNKDLFTKKYSSNINSPSNIMSQSKNMSKKVINIFCKFYLKITNAIV